MPIQLIRENIELERVSGDGSVQALIEGSVMLPGSARDAAPLYADAHLELGRVEAQTDRVALDGQAYFTLVYAAGEDKQVRSVETALNFSHILDVPEAGPKAAVEVQGVVEHVEAEIIGGKALLKAVARLRARAEIQSTVACLTDIDDVDSLQILSSTVQSMRTAAKGDSRVVLEERFELPFGLESVETLFSQARTQIDSVTPSGDKIDVSGQVFVDVYHRTTMFDRPIARTKHVMPFLVAVDAAGAEAGLLAQADAEARGFLLSLDLLEDEKFLNVSCTVAVKAQAQELFETETIIDAYVAGDETLLLKTESTSTRTDVREVRGEDSIRAITSIGEDQRPISTALAAFARPAMWELTGEGRTHAEGVLEATVIYNPSGEEGLAVIKEEIPFRASFDFALPEDAWSRLTVTDVEAIQVTGERLELKCALELTARIYDHQKIQIALEAEMAEESEPVPGGVTLYFAQPGDDLWSVAKRFRTTKESLTRFNPDVDELRGGEKLLLYKRVMNV